jgi:catechol 2,3-dioxygenase
MDTEPTKEPRASRWVPQVQSPRPIDPRVDIGHVHLKSADLDRVRRFYVDILGFHVVRRGPGALFLSVGGYHHNFAFNTWESKGGQPPAAGTTGLYHVAIRYPTRAALGDALRRLVGASWPLNGVNDHGTHEALYVRDPDGNGLELCWDRPPEQWPVDRAGHLRFKGRRLDLESLFNEGVDDAPTAAPAERTRSI